MYHKELTAIKKSNRYRERKISDESLIDLASNDYLGLASNKVLFQKAYERVLANGHFGPKASILVNGYSTIHKTFEEALCQANGFEEGVIVGSGFLANLSMIEALVRKKDTLFIDEEYHASGMVATKLLQKNQVILFKHNDANDLKAKIEASNTLQGRVVIAIEGVYSMHGDIASREIFDIADDYNAILIVDEAHSSGVIGENLLGIFDYYNIQPKQNHIKMGTLGKAYGSYGAYILSSKAIIDFLINRAKAIIYTTAPSLFDTAMGLESLYYILEHKKELKAKIEKNLEIIENILNIKSKSLIIPIIINDNKKVLEIQSKLKESGLVVGAIRQPTVKEAIIRLIAKIDINQKDLIQTCNLLKEYR
ncbi:MAG: aminotransferase class I/II-fold pyridoxal phosphate-dependent enzyme [Candidatus Marinarcus sp.]|uniref:aminotransferase class I/II-fold pyridoxal phosphate-dependent enzyme n=1 Tax=Candidatus Marinarcus sp. TaxID=3100987 RepID=UPI003B00C8D7